MVVFTVLIYILLANIIVTETDLLTIKLNESSQCEPNKIYKHDNGTCLCSNNGTWSHQECVSNFHSVNKNCDPHKYVIVDCNVCLCGPDGKINKSRCSQHDCDYSNRTRRSDAIVGTCDPKTFYALAPCQFCYCVNKYKLVCNNKPKTFNVHLGQYELNKCGDNLIKELSDLLPTKHQRSKKKADKSKTRLAKQFKMTTAILLDNYEANSLEKLKSNRENYSHKDLKYNDYENTMINKRHQQLFKGTNYDEDDSEILKAVTNDVSNDYSTETHKKNKALKIKSKISDLETIISDPGLYDEENQSHLVKIDVPSVLEKVLSLVLRKSMVSLESGHNCRLGSTMKDKCNTCFCLSNGKMLCTKNICE